MKRRRQERREEEKMPRKITLILTGAFLLTMLTLSFSQDRIQTKPVPQQVPADKLQPRQPAQPGPSSAPERKDAKGVCPKLAFVTTSPLPSTSLGWDYKVQLEISGGYPPVRFRAYFTDDSRVETLGQYVLRGLPITPSGLIQGQADVPGYHIIRIVAEDSCPSGVQRVEKKFVLEVKGPTK
jgi:hypothetical protein